MKTTIDLAKSLYDACPTVKPDWDQLGDVTQSVWIERAQAVQVQHATATAATPPASNPATPPSPDPASASALQIDLF